MRHSREQKLMIDFANNRAWCFYCQEWISHENLYIDGTHGSDALNSGHTIWPETVGQQVIADSTKVEAPSVVTDKPEIDHFNKLIEVLNECNFRGQIEIARLVRTAILARYGATSITDLIEPNDPKLTDDIPPMIPDIRLHAALESDIHRDIERYGE